MLRPFAQGFTDAKLIILSFVLDTTAVTHEKKYCLIDKLIIITISKQ